MMAVLAVGTAACSNGSSDDGNDGLTVVASFYPLEEAARAVGGSAVEVENLTPPGVEPHDLELSSDRIDDILDADVVLYLGGGFQPAVRTRCSSGTPTRSRSTCWRGSVPRSIPRPRRERGERDLGPARVAGPGAVPTRRGHRLRCPEQSDDPGGLHSRGRPTELRRRNSKIESIGSTPSTGMGSRSATPTCRHHARGVRLPGRPVRLRQEPITGLSPEGEPDPARLADIEDLIRREHVTTVFTEPLVSSDVADTIARETGVQVAVLDPIENLTQESATGATTTSRSCGRTSTPSWRRWVFERGRHDGGRKPRAGRDRARPLGRGRVVLVRAGAGARRRDVRAPPGRVRRAGRAERVGEVDPAAVPARAAPARGGSGPSVR